MKSKLFVVLSAVMLLLAGCGPKEVVAPVPSPSGAATPTPTATPSPTPTPTPTPEPTEEVKELWGFPIDETHDAFEVPTGGKLGTVLVTVEQGEEGEDWPYCYTFSVWAADDWKKPIQTMTAEGVALFGYELMDANFDGYMDFGYQRSWGTGGFFYHHWIWDEATGQFVAVPELSQFGDVVFEEETQTVRGHIKAGFAGLLAEDHIYRWESGELVCVRVIEMDPKEDVDGGVKVKVTVSDRIDGVLTRVFSTEETVEAEKLGDDVVMWYDLDYHGEA